MIPRPGNLNTIINVLVNTILICIAKIQYCNIENNCEDPNNKTYQRVQLVTADRGESLRVTPSSAERGERGQKNCERRRRERSEQVEERIIM